MWRFLTSPYFYLILPPLFWSGNAVVGRAMAMDIPPVAFNFWRWALALAIVLPLAAPRAVRQWPAVRARWKTVVVLGILGITAYNSFLYTAVQTTTAVNVGLISATMPVMIVVLSWLWLGDRIGPRQAAGVAVALAGVVLVVGRGNPAVLVAVAPVPGDLWMLGAAAAWSIYSVVLRRHPVALDPMMLLTVTVAAGLVAAAPLYLYHYGLTLPFALTPETLATMAYVAAFPSVAAYGAWNSGVATAGPNVAGYYSYLLPVFTGLMAVGFLDEPLRWFHLVGLAVVFAGIWLSTHGGGHRTRGRPDKKFGPAGNRPESREECVMGRD